MALVHVNQWGASLGLRLPQLVCKHLEINKGSILSLTEQDNKIVLEVVKTKKNLKVMLAAITADNIHEEISAGEVRGKEEW